MTLEMTFKIIMLKFHMSNKFWQLKISSISYLF